MKSADDIVKRALTLLDEQVTDILNAASTEMSVGDMAHEILPEVCRNLVKELPFELKRYIAKKGTLTLDSEGFGERQILFVKKKVSYQAPADFWELVCLRLKQWAKPVTNYILIDSPEYCIQNNPFTRGGKQNPVVALSSVRSVTTETVTLKNPVNGLHYNYAAITNSSPICASNARVPSKADWENLFSAIIELATFNPFWPDETGIFPDAGTPLRENNDAYWNQVIAGTDEFGFAARGAGCITDESTLSKSVARFWSTSEINGDDAFCAEVNDESDDAFISPVGMPKTSGLPIRLIVAPEEFVNGYGIYTGNDQTKYLCKKMPDENWWTITNLIETKYRDGSSITFVQDDELATEEGEAGAIYNNSASYAYSETEETIEIISGSDSRIECFSVHKTDVPVVEVFEYVSFDNYPKPGNSWPDELFEPTTKALAAELNAIKDRLQNAESRSKETITILDKHN